MDKEYVAVVCIVNDGFAEAVMDAAKEAGARGGTVLLGRGTTGKDAEAYFHITVQNEKEIVLILTEKEDSDRILHALYRKVGLQTPGQGIAFSLPVDDVVGLSGNTGGN